MMDALKPLIDSAAFWLWSDAIVRVIWNGLAVAVICTGVIVGVIVAARFARQSKGGAE